MTDAQMVERCKKGDRDAFNGIIEKYQTQVFNTLYGMLSNYQDAEDATQEVFIKVYRSVASFKGQSSFSTWLYRICANVCNDTLRKRQRRGIVLSIDTDADDEETGGVRNIASDEPTPEERLEMDERQQLVWKALGELSREYREIIVYYDMRQLSYEEISKILRCPIGTVKSRLSRARKALKKRLSEKQELF